MMQLIGKYCAWPKGFECERLVPSNGTHGWHLEAPRQLEVPVADAPPRSPRQSGRSRPRPK